jgi:hypothetical protein
MKAYFPNVKELMDLIQAELPEGVYAADRADDPDKTSVSSSELRAHAAVLADLYSNLKTINDDKTLSTLSQSGLSYWEKELFLRPQDTSLSYEMRLQNLLAKKRSSGGISLPAIQSVIDAILKDVDYALLPYSGQADGAWRLGESVLSERTYLSLRDPIWGARRDRDLLGCDQNLEASGVSEGVLREIQATAYTYEVRIFSEISDELLRLLDQRLKELEPARSTHLITIKAIGPAEADILDLGSFDQHLLTDEIDCGTFDRPAGSYNLYDFGGTNWDQSGN